MGLMRKFTAKPSQKLAAAAPDGPKIESAGGPAAPSYSAAPVVESFSEPDDEPTLFTTFMICYLGFFGVSLLLYPTMFAESWNPMPYWTEITPAMCFIFRIAGAGFLTLVLGPFLDEIFGGAGVMMKAFERQMLIINIIVFIVFMYYTFYAPLDTAVNWVWQGQTYFAGIMLAWSIIEVAGKSLAVYYNLFTACYFGFFAVGLAAAPDVMFGPGLSPFVYWNEWTPLSILTGRSLGIAIICLIVLGYFLFAGVMYGGSLAKMFAVSNTLNCALFVLPAYYGGASAAASMWELQLAAQVPLVLVGLYIIAAGFTGPWTCASLCPSCGNDISTFNFVNFVWYFPFAVGFMTVPDLMFGPGAIPGIPMIVVPLDETSLWFGKAWGMSMLLLVLGPYAFGLPAAKVAKQLVFSYLLFVSLFAYGIFFTDIFNVMLIGPLTGVNALIGIWGLTLVWPRAGESMF